MVTPFFTFVMGVAITAFVQSVHDQSSSTWQGVWSGLFFVSALVAIGYYHREHP